MVTVNCKIVSNFKELAVVLELGASRRFGHGPSSGLDDWSRWGRAIYSPSATALARSSSVRAAMAHARRAPADWSLPTPSPGGGWMFTVAPMMKPGC